MITSLSIIDKPRAALKNLASLVRSGVWLLHGMEAFSNEPFTLLFAGSETHKEYFASISFRGSYADLYLGKKYCWQIRRLLKGRTYPCDLAVLQGSRHAAHCYDIGSHYFVPLLLKIGAHLPFVPTGSAKSDIRKIIKNGLNYEVTADISAMSEFFYHYYLPSIRNRHGGAAIEIDYADLMHKASRGECLLMMVTKDNRKIAGGLILLESPPRFWTAGIRDGDLKLLKDGAAAALYYFGWKYLEAKGHHEVNLGMTRSFLNDGVLQYKIKWRARIIGYEKSGFMLKPLNSSRGLQGFCSGHPFVYLRGRNLYGAVFDAGDAHHSDENREALKAKYDLEGLSGINVISLNETTAFPPRQRPFDDPAPMNAKISRSWLSRIPFFRSQSRGDSPDPDGNGDPRFRRSRACMQNRGMESPERECADAGTGRGQADFASSCLVLLKELLYLQKGERLLLYTDNRAAGGLAEEIRRFAAGLGIEAHTFPLDESARPSDMIPALSDHIEHGRYAAVIELSEQSFYPTRVWSQASKSGSRVYSLGPMDAGSFVRCLGTVHHARLHEFGRGLYGLLMRARRVRVGSDSGTDIVFRMNNASISAKVLSKLRRMERSTVWQPSGILMPGVDATFLGGQVAFLGVPHTIEGRAVIDGYMWPPREVGHLDDPITLDIHHGEVATIAGCPSKSAILRQWLNGKEKKIEHFCIGYHPGARLSDNLCEAERALGHLDIGIGKYPFHTDGIIKNPKVILDDVVLMENHRFVHPALPFPEEDLPESS